MEKKSWAASSQLKGQRIYYSVKTKFEIQKKPAKKPRKKQADWDESSPKFPTYTKFVKVLGYRDVIKLLDF